MDPAPQLANTFLCLDLPLHWYFFPKGRKIIDPSELGMYVLGSDMYLNRRTVSAALPDLEQRVSLVDFAEELGAWWAPRTGDLISRIEATPPVEDSDLILEDWPRRLRLDKSYALASVLDRLTNNVNLFALRLELLELLDRAAHCLQGARERPGLVSVTARNTLSVQAGAWHFEIAASAARDREFYLVPPCCSELPATPWQECCPQFGYESTVQQLREALALQGLQLL